MHRKTYIAISFQRIKEDVLIEDESGKPLKALLVFSHSVKYLVDKFHQLSKSQGIGINDDEIMWVLTVPAIWSESAKSFMRKAAVQAGIKNEHLKIALEPEAASLLCQHIPIERTKEGISVADVGTTYMVIDLGGGTVDITVHEKLPRGKLKEIHKASGGPWGGTAVDEGFIQLLTKVVGGPVINRLRREHIADYLEMMREFEVSKRSLDPNGDLSFKVRVPPSLDKICQNETSEHISSLVTEANSPFAGKMKIIGDKLVIDRKLMKDIFEHVEKKILVHVQEIMRLPDVANIDFVLLVGGFAESMMVQHFMKENLESERRRVIIPPESGLSVVKGAVIYGHHPSIIESRSVRFTYGYNMSGYFDSDKHPESRKFIDQYGSVLCKGVFCPFVKAGSSIKTGETIREELSLPERDIHLAVYYTEAEDVMFTDDKRLRKLYTIYLKDILPQNIKENQTLVYQFSFGETEVGCEIHLPEIGFEGKVPDTFKLE
ncbi:hypothetical protein FSP39_004848 [Pinctada imbricata]|uniref:Heat shock 70 kDa protein 12A n=1 Tax=Pinctada imbricata TaxID=66713 RepID=A0AA88XH92_PINIB|nr:hypothetical protein FSP39_004848 [Pinctada imbricata]